MRAHLLLPASLLVSTLACVSAPPELPPRITLPVEAEHAAAWRGDLAVLVEQLPARHVDAFRVTPEDAWRSSAARLDADIPQLADHEVLVEFARLCTAVGDGHSGFWLADPRLGFRRHPLWLMWFEDGVFVKGVTDETAVALNGRVVAIGGVPIEECLERVAAVTPHDNVSGLKHSLPDVLVQGEVLAAIGLAPDAHTATFQVEAADGRELEVVSMSRDAGERITYGVHYTDGGEAPLSERMRGASWGEAWLDDGHVLYVQYNLCLEGKDETFRAYCERLFKRVDAFKPGRIVIDLRFNPGGSSSLVAPLLAALEERADRYGKGRLYVLIGRRTFSSGLWAALDLDKRTAALLVGEPTGGTPNAPGEVGRLVLPRSTLSVRYANRFWQRGGPDYPGPALQPELLVLETSREHFAGRDPVLEAAMTHPMPGETIALPRTWDRVVN